MNRLSSPITDLMDHYEVIIIGSGYGGSIAASRLARAGRQVCLLERGKEILPGDFPDTFIEAIKETQVNTEDKHIGEHSDLYRYDVNDDMSVLSGCGLGGTSLINANVAIRPDPRVFEDTRWPQSFRDDVEKQLEKGYQHAQSMLKPTPYPDDFPALPKLDALEKSADFMNEEFYRLNINVTFESGVNHVGVHQEACILCGDCMAGCNYHAKNTTYMNYLPDARNHGAQMFTQVEARYIEQEAHRWIVHYQILDSGREMDPDFNFSVSADILILAASTMGTNEILLRSKQNGLTLSDQLGSHFSGNADVGGGAYNSDQVINAIGLGQRGHALPPVGPSITGAIDIRDTENVEAGILIEDGALASKIAELLPESLFAAAALSGEDTDSGIADEASELLKEIESLVRGPYHGAVNRTQLFLVMAQDDSGGRLSLKDDRLRIDWPGIGNQPFVHHVNEKLLEATRALGGTFIENPIWANLPTRNMATAHPLGGCIMGIDAGQGVVDHKGRVFAGNSGTAVHEELYICDASVIPRSLGANPLLTISAIAERTIALLAKDYGWEIDYDFKPVPPAPTDIESTQ